MIESTFQRIAEKMEIQQMLLPYDLTMTNNLAGSDF